MHGDFISTERLVTLGADPGKIEEFRLQQGTLNQPGFVEVKQETGGAIAPDFFLYQTAIILPWLLDNQNDFTPMNLIGWR